MKKYSLLCFLAFMGGALYAFGFPSFLDTQKNFFLAPIIGTGLLFLSFPGVGVYRKIPVKVVLLSIVLFSLGHAITGLYWIPETIRVFGQIPVPVNYILADLFSIFAVPQFFAMLLVALAAPLLLRKAKRKFVGPWPSLKRVPAMPASTRHLFYATAFTLCELWTPQQFPAHLGHAWLSFSPYLGLTPYFGAPLFSLISFWLILALLGSIKDRKADVFSFLGLSLLALANFLHPLRGAPVASEGQARPREIQVRLVQANIGNYLKVVAEKGHPNSIHNTPKRYYDLSVGPYVPGTNDKKDIDLIVWPETAYPHAIDSKRASSSNYRAPRIFQEIQDSLPHTEILFGGYDEKKPAQSYFQNSFDAYYETLYNAAFFLGEGGMLKGVYHKHLLIPFGETLPFGPLNYFLGHYVDNISYFSRGESFELFETRDHFFFTSAICYELLFSGHIRDMLNSLKHPPHFLVNLTNDSWYGDTAEPEQHLFLARWRSLEFQIPIVRSTNTGISSVVYPDGGQGPRLKIDKEGILDFRLVLEAHPTPTFYQRWGTLSWTGLAAILMVLSYLLPLILSSFGSLLGRSPSFKRS